MSRKLWTQAWTPVLGGGGRTMTNFWPTETLQQNVTAPEIVDDDDESNWREEQERKRERAATSGNGEENSLWRGRVKRQRCRVSHSRLGCLNSASYIIETRDLLGLFYISSVLQLLIFKNPFYKILSPGRSCWIESYFPPLDVSILWKVVVTYRRQGHLEKSCPLRWKSTLLTVNRHLGGEIFQKT